MKHKILALHKIFFIYESKQANVHSFFKFGQETTKSHNKHNQLTFSIQHLGDVQVFFSHFKGVVQISHRIILDRSQFQATETFISTSLQVRNPPLLDNSCNHWVSVHLSKTVVVDEIRSVPVNQSVEGKTVLPAGGEKTCLINWYSDISLRSWEKINTAVFLQGAAFLLP